MHFDMNKYTEMCNNYPTYNDIKVEIILTRENNTIETIPMTIHIITSKNCYEQCIKKLNAICHEFDNTNIQMSYRILCED